MPKKKLSLQDLAALANQEPVQQDVAVEPVALRKMPKEVQASTATAWILEATQDRATHVRYIPDGLQYQKEGWWGISPHETSIEVIESKPAELGLSGEDETIKVSTPAYVTAHCPMWACSSADVTVTEYEESSVLQHRWVRGSYVDDGKSGISRFNR